MISPTIVTSSWIFSLPSDFELDQAENGREGLKLIRKHVYDIVLSDIIMPFMSGYDMIRAIREDPTYKDLCVVAISASLMQLSAIEKDEMRSFDGFISKPVQTNELLAVVSQKLGIQWIYPEQQHDEATPTSAPEGGPALEGNTLIEELCWLARIGDVKALRAKAAPLKEIDAPLAEEFSSLLRTYKAQQAAELLTGFINKKGR